MKIRKIKVNGFGKLRNKDIDFTNGINIVYGENEAGKSSLLKFISSMLYGTSKNKNGKELSDFDRFLPWNSEDFSGKLEYELDDGNIFEVYREFKKKNPIIYNSLKEDISKQFKMDKTKGIDFFYEQTGIDEETFFSTAISEQEGIKLSRSAQNGVVQKISNMISSGDDNISYKKAMDRIVKRQTEDVGTERTNQRPVNIVDRRIETLLGQKKALEVYKETIYDNTVVSEKLSEELYENEIKRDFLKEIKRDLDSKMLKNAEIDFNKNLEDDFEKKIEELNRKIIDDRYKVEYKPFNKNKYLIIIGVLVAFCVLLMIVNSFKLINLIALLPIFIVLLFMSQDYAKHQEYEKKHSKDEQLITSELEVLKESQESKKTEREEKEKELNEEIVRDQEELIKKYKNKMDDCFIEKCLNASYDSILKSIDNIENRINTVKFKLHTIEVSAKDVNSKLDDLAKIEEELADAEEEKDELKSLNKSFNIARECLERAYDQVKENISPRFLHNLCDIISNVSDGAYKKVAFSDTEGLKVEISNGSYVPASRLSIGTIDQMYLSLRFSALNEITEENIPIVLDEAFVYFDDERLKNVFRYVYSNFPNHQIIILTCSRREMNLLKEMQLDYNFIKL